jgi:hypothetical protein
LLDWLRVEYAIEMPSNSKQNAETLKPETDSEINNKGAKTRRGRGFA